MSDSCIIITIILSAGLLGGLTNFFMLYDNKLTSQENWIKLFAAIFLSISASITVPLFLQILSNNLLDDMKFKNLLIFAGFCVIAGFFSKRFLEDLYTKLNKLKKKVDAVEKETSEKLKTVTTKTEKVIKQVEDLEENTEELESDKVSTEINASIEKHKPDLLTSSDRQLILQSLLSSKYSWRTLTGISKETSLAKEKAEEVLLLLADLGFVEKKVNATGKFIWRVLKYPIRIYSATYLWPTGQIDVTEKIKELVDKGIYVGEVHPKTFGIPDPAHRVQKTLKIHCRINGQEKDLTFKDFDTFKLK